MCGSPVTSGLSANRSSSAASGTTMVSSCRMAWPQNEMPRAVSHTSSPWRDLNHCRFSSMSDSSTMGMSNSCAANAVSRSNRSSGGVSRISNWRRACRRSSSWAGRGGSFMAVSGQSQWAPILGREGGPRTPWGLFSGRGPGPPPATACRPARTGARRGAVVCQS